MKAKLNKDILLYAWLAVLTVVVAVTSFGRRTFGELDVERLNIVEANGNPRVIISNAARFPGLYFQGKHYRHPGREKGEVERGGFLFFNNEGTEVGGMLFGTGLDGDKRYANSSFLLDQYNQDQIMGLQYSEYGGKRSAGLRVWDQPDKSLEPLIQLVNKAAYAPTEAERKAADLELEAETKKSPRFGERFFAGKNEGDAVVKLSDEKGRPRLVMRVTKEGQPSVEFLSEKGRVIKRIRP